MFLINRAFLKPLANTIRLSSFRYISGKNNNGITTQKIAENSSDSKLWDVAIINSLKVGKHFNFKDKREFILKNLPHANMNIITGLIKSFEESKINDDELFKNLRNSFLRLGDKGIYSSYSLVAAGLLLKKNPRDNLVLDYITKIIKNKQYETKDLVNTFLMISQTKEKLFVELFTKEIVNSVEHIIYDKFAILLLRELTKQNYRNDQFYIKFSENISKLQLDDPAKDLSQIFSAFSSLDFSHDSIRDAQDFLIQKYHSFLRNRELSNILHALLNSYNKISQKSWDLLKSDIEKQNNLADNLIDLSSIFHSYKKLKFDMEPLFKYLTEENLRRCNGNQFAIILFSFRHNCKRDWVPIFKKITLEKIDSMHPKSALSMAMFWTETFYWDSEFWREFEPAFDSKVSQLQTDFKEAEAINQLKSVGARLVRYKVLGR